MDFEKVIRIKESRHFYCSLCGDKFESEAQARRHIKKRCRNIFLAFNKSAYNILRTLIKGLAYRDEYKYYFETKDGIDLLYSLENPMTQEEALEYGL